MEAFCSDHNVTFDEVLYDWPARKFEGLYDAYCRRKMADELSYRRGLEMAAIWANANADDEARQKTQLVIDEIYSKSIYKLYEGRGQEDVEDNGPDYSDPFWQAAERGLQDSMRKTGTGE